MKRMTRREALLTACLLPAFLGIASGARAADDTINIGIIMELTGPGSFYGLPSKDAIELRLEQAGYSAGGKKINVIWEDDATKPATAVEKAKKLVELDKADMLLGPLFSDAQDAMAPYLSRHKVINAACAGGNWNLHERPNWIVFPGTPETSDSPLGDYAYDQGYRTMVTVGQDYSAGYGHVGGPVDKFKARGGEIIQQDWVPYPTPDYAPYLTSLKKADVFVAWLVMPDFLTLVKQYYQYKIKTPLMIGEAENLAPEHLKELGPQAVGLIGNLRGYTTRIDNPENKKFVAAYQAKYHRDPSYIEGFAYTCMDIYLQGLEATHGNPKLEVLKPAIIGLKLKEPGGPVAFSSNGYALTNRYLAKASLDSKGYYWAPFKAYEALRDPRDQ
jgi:branched-chain amino acid transport system substrate-binding protein